MRISLLLNFLQWPQYYIITIINIIIINIRNFWDDRFCARENVLRYFVHVFYALSSNFLEVTINFRF